MSECRKIQPVVDAFVDGELSTERVFETEEHLGGCHACQERVSLTQALHVSTRRAVHDSARVSSSFEERVRAALAAERAREEAAQPRAQTERSKPLPWRTVVPVAAAAAMALAFAGKTDGKRTLIQTDAHPGLQDSVIAANAGVADEEQLIEELIRLHASSPTPEVTEPTLMPQLEREVGFPVRLEPELNRYGASWQGGSVVPVRNEPAASLYYHLDGHRLTVYVFDAERVRLQRTNVLKPRVVRDRPVFVGTKRGYSIAAIENRGVGYALATDLDTQESAELVASIH
jgi:anti-sigma factor RsiW